MDISQQISNLQHSVPDHITIIAVSKTQPVSRMLDVYHAGLRNFGENKAQELVLKHSVMPGDSVWHFIGHLQSNKVRQIAPFVNLIHSVDSLSLLKEINRQAYRSERVIDCLLQFYIATEETKFGLDMSEAHEILDAHNSGEFGNIRITGVMGMASFSVDENLVRSEFRELRRVFNTLQSGYFADQPSFSIVSMGMSGDFQIAIEEGSTMIRVGTLIFGER